MLAFLFSVIEKFSFNYPTSDMLLQMKLEQTMLTVLRSTLGSRIKSEFEVDWPLSVTCSNGKDGVSRMLIETSDPEESHEMPGMDDEM